MPEAILLKDVDGVGQPRSRRRRLQGLPPQLPDPAQARRAGHQGPAPRGRRATRTPTTRRPRRASPQAQEHAEQLNKTVLTIAQQAGEDGRLFGSVTTQDIADEIKAARGIDVDRRKIHLDDPIKNVGTYQVVLEVAEGVTATVKVMVSEA